MSVCLYGNTAIGKCRFFCESLNALQKFSKIFAMDNHLRGNVARVSCAARGIGRGIAQRLRRNGAAVAGNYAKNSKDANHLA